MFDNSKSNIFARMSDRQDIVDFVKEIEKYTCLYDQNSYQYANKSLKKRSWMDIARKYKSTVPDCKEKWRKIRIAYMRSLKLCKSSNPPSRPYYLADYLHFISPYKSCDDNVPTTNSPPSPSPSDVSLKLEIDEYDQLDDTSENIEDKRSVDLTPSSSSYNQSIDMTMHDRGKPFNGREDARVPFQNPNNITNNSNEIDVRFREGNSRFQVELPRDVIRTNEGNARLERQKSLLMEENNPRRMFLMSLLPDIETLTEQEMRSFRREVIALLDKIMATRDSVIVNVTR